MGLASVPLVRADSDELLAVGFRVVAIALLALTAALVLGWPSLVPVSLIALGGLYGMQLAIDDVPLDSAAPLVAAGLLVTAELAHWSLEEREAVKAEPGEDLRRVGFVSLLALGTLLVAASLLALVDLVRAGGLAIDLVGAGAAAAVLIAVALLARARLQPDRR